MVLQGAEILTNQLKIYLPCEMRRTETCKATKCRFQYSCLQTMGLFVLVSVFWGWLFPFRFAKLRFTLAVHFYCVWMCAHNQTGQTGMKDQLSTMITDQYPSVCLEEHTWMVVQHNNTELTRLRPSPGVNQHSIYFDYSTADEQLLAAVSQSEHCEQELSYHCRRSRLLNTPGRGRSENVWPKQTMTCVLFEKLKICPSLWFYFYLKLFFFLKKGRTIHTQI